MEKVNTTKTSQPILTVTKTHSRTHTHTRNTLTIHNREPKSKYRLNRICDVKCLKNLTKYRLTKKITGQIGPWFKGLHLKPLRYRGTIVNQREWTSESVILLTKAAIINFSHRFVIIHSHFHLSILMHQAVVIIVDNASKRISQFIYSGYLQRARTSLACLRNNHRVLDS